MVQTMKQLATEYIPCGEELHSAICDLTFPLSDWTEFAYETPEICLENEMQWPEEPDLIY